MPDSSSSSMLTPRKRIRNTPRTPRTRQFAVSTTGTEVAHIETIEADPPLRIFPPVLVDQIRRYLVDRAAHGQELDLAFAKKGNTKLHVNPDGFPTHFVIPETDQQLDAGRYRYGLIKQSPIIVVVQQKQDSSVSFNNGQPAIVLYHGKHSSLGGPDKVSKWALWSIDGLRTDTIVWRIAEGARSMKTTEDSDDDDAPQKLEESFETPPISSSQLVYGHNRSIFQEAIDRHSAQIPLHWDSLDMTPQPEVDVSTGFDQCASRTGMVHHGSNRTMPIDPQILTTQPNIGVEMSGGSAAANGTLNFLNSTHLNSSFPHMRQQTSYVPVRHHLYTDDFHFFPCACRGHTAERRQAEMVAATEKVLLSGLSGAVKFNFRISMECETRLSKTLEDCRTTSQVFAYGRLHKTILLEHSVISIHVMNGMMARRPLYLVLDDVEHWKLLISVIMQELILREKDAQEKKSAVSPLELMVLDEGY